MRTLDFIEKQSLRSDLPAFRVGDAVRVHVRVREGDKERIQVFEGLVIRRRGAGASETFTVRKISSGVGVERIFPVQSPVVSRLEVKSRGFVRRSRLYFLRDLSGKKARLTSKVRDLAELLTPGDEPAAAEASEEAAEAVVEAAASETAEAETGKALKGKARKKAKAKEKAARKASTPAAAESESASTEA